jgi:hypothetical protein
VPTVPIPDVPDPGRLVELEAEIDDLRLLLVEARAEIASHATELRTRRVVVLDDIETPVVDLHSDGDHGRVVIGQATGEIVLDAGPDSSACIDVLSGHGRTEVGVHVRAEAEAKAAGVSLSATGNVFGEYHVTQVEPDGEWTTRVVSDDPR